MKKIITAILFLISLTALADRASFEKACYDENGSTYVSTADADEVLSVRCEIWEKGLRGDRLVKIFSACSSNLKKVAVTEVATIIYRGPFTNIECDLK